MVNPYHACLALSTDKVHQGLIYKDLFTRQWVLIHTGKCDDRICNLQIMAKSSSCKKAINQPGQDSFTLEKGTRSYGPWCNICLNEWEIFDLPNR